MGRCFKTAESAKGLCVLDVGSKRIQCTKQLSANNHTDHLLIRKDVLKVSLPT